MLVNMDNLTNLTGITRRTIQKRLIDIIPVVEKGRGHWYESKEVLPILLGLQKAGEDKKTLESERTRLASAQATKTELEVEVIKGNLIPADHVKEVVDTMLSSFRSKLLSLPTKAAHAVLPLADHAEAESVLRDYVYEALQELADYDSEKYCTSDNKPISEVDGSTTNSDSKSVGGRQKKTVEGSVKRTRKLEH